MVLKDCNLQWAHPQKTHLEKNRKNKSKCWSPFPLLRHYHILNDMRSARWWPRGPCQIYRRVTLPSSSISPATKTRSERKPVLGIHPLTYRTIHIQLLFSRSLNPQTYPEKALVGFQTPTHQVFGGFWMCSLFWAYFECGLLPVTITTRIITCVVWGFQPKPSFATDTGRHTQKIYSIHATQKPSSL